jgi:hypothetical protein
MMFNAIVLLAFLNGASSFALNKGNMISRSVRVYSSVDEGVSTSEEGTVTFPDVSDSTTARTASREFVPPPAVKKAALKAEWLPILNMDAPTNLDGSLAGDVGFDPLNFSSSRKTLYWMREAETKHARLAMLAAVGWPLSELWHKELANALGLESILADGDRVPSLLNGGLSNPYATGMLMMSIIIAGLLEGKAMNSGEVFWNAEKPKDYVPGNYGFDPLNLYNVKGNKKTMETAEIKNGRLAMVAISTFALSEFLTGLPVTEQTPFLF